MLCGAGDITALLLKPTSKCVPLGLYSLFTLTIFESCYMAWYSICLSLPWSRETHAIPKRSIWFSTVSVTADTSHCQCPWWGHLANRTPLIEGLCETMFAHAWHVSLLSSCPGFPLRTSWNMLEPKLLTNLGSH